MLRASQLKAMPAQHVFARGDGEFPELHKKRCRWVAIWGGFDWAIRFAPAEKNYKEVEKEGKIVRNPKNITNILPADSEAMKLYAE